MRFVAHGYQSYCIGRMIEEPKLGLFLDMGLGKTPITLTALQDLKYNRLAIGKALVIAPKRVAESTWSREADKWDHLSLLRVSVVLGTARQRIRALCEASDVYVINRDNVSWLVKYYGNAWPFDVVVVDEFSSFKSGQSKRFKALKNMLPHIDRLYGLTGTPAPNGLMDLWSQIYLLDGGVRLGKTLDGYRARYFDHNPYRHEFKARPGADSAVHDAIRDICISMRAEDYLTLPDCVTVDVPVTLDAPAREAYDALEKDMLLDVDGTDIEATTAVALTGKLLQLCNGAVYGTNGEVAAVHNAKIEALTELVEGLNGAHALVFYGFRHDIPRIQAALLRLDKGLRVRLMRTSEDERAWNAGEVDILLAHPASAAFGLNLQDGGHHVIWFGLTWSLELYQQANKRLHRQGQTSRVIVHRLVVEQGMDEDVITALKGKGDTQDALLDALKARIGKVKTMRKDE